MTPKGRKIWASKAGQSLLGNMLEGKPLTEENKQVVAALKKSGPPNVAPSRSSAKPSKSPSTMSREEVVALRKHAMDYHRSQKAKQLNLDLATLEFKRSTKQ